MASGPGLTNFIHHSKLYLLKEISCEVNPKTLIANMVEIGKKKKKKTQQHSILLSQRKTFGMTF